MIRILLKEGSGIKPEAVHDAALREQRTSRSQDTGPVARGVGTRPALRWWT
jgi:hypothetical protein